MKRKYWWIILILALILILPFLRNKSLSGIGQLISSQSVNLPDNFENQPISGHPQVQISTPKGDFVLELRPDLAPKTVGNFLGRFAQGQCDGLTFHRVEDWVVQGCDPKGDGTGGELTLPTEISSASFVAGSLGVARRTTPKDKSNNYQFFIVKTNSTFLDGEYTYFGRVVSGMDVVNRLSVGDKILFTDILTK